MGIMDYLNSQDMINTARPWGWDEVASDHAEAISGIDLGVSGEDYYGVTVNKGLLKVLVEEIVRDFLGKKENNPVITQKYKMKHK